jgi:hypothetical protein
MNGAAGASAGRTASGAIAKIAAIAGRHPLTGFSLIATSARLARGQHKVALACKEFTGNTRIDVPTIAAIAIGSR